MEPYGWTPGIFKIYIWNRPQRSRIICWARFWEPSLPYPGGNR